MKQFTAVLKVRGLAPIKVGASEFSLEPQGISVRTSQFFQVIPYEQIQDWTVTDNELSMALDHPRATELRVLSTVDGAIRECERRLTDLVAAGGPQPPNQPR